VTDRARAFSDLVPALRRLDARLACCLTALPDTRGREPGALPDSGDLLAGLAAPPGTPRFADARAATDWELVGETEGALGRLRTAFRLTEFELDLVLIAVAPDIDLRYAAVFAALDDREEPGRASAGLGLDLLCLTAEEKAERQAALEADAPLIRHRLLRVEAEAGAPLLAGLLVPEPQLLGFLLGSAGLPASLAACCTLVRPSFTMAELGLTGRVAALGEPATKPLRCWLTEGPRGQALPEALAAARGKMLLRADMSLKEAAAAVAEATLRDAVLCLPIGETANRPRLIAELALPPDCDVVIVAPDAGPVAEGFTLLDPAPPDAAMRLAWWQRELAAANLTLTAMETALLADRFRATPEAIRAACAAAGGEPSAFPALLRSLKQGHTHMLHGIARRIDARQDWADLVLPPEQIGQLRDLCDQVAHRHLVEQVWGFSRGLAPGRGICALFSGPSGTGKTMAAGILARALHLDLYRVDLAQIVSKYIGETEKNLDRVFTAAQNADAVLFFDEADALFGKRGEVKDSHDRYANLEVGYLLQKMEEYDGLAILATNLRQHIDDAFTRRLRFIIEFPSPDEYHRRRIWQVVFPPQAPLAAGVDFDALARDVRLPGGNIRNIALSAAFLAAAEGVPIGQVHLLRAARAEYQKVGRTWSGAAG
jgi:hypothetical protein